MSPIFIPLHYFYPEVSSAENLELKLNSGSTYEENVVARDDILLFKCGLLIPCNADNYDNFKMQMRDSEKVFTDKLYS